MEKTEVKYSKIFIRVIEILCIAVVLASVLITVANYLPLNEKNKINTFIQLSEEGYFPEVPTTSGEHEDFHSMNPTTLELATDNLMIKMALYEGEGKGIQQAFRCYSTQYEEEYSRYWHGYVVVLRPLLYFFNYYEIRIINSFLQMLLFFAVASMVYKKKGLKYALAIGISYFLLMPLALGQCLQYTWMFYVIFGALFVYLRFSKYWDQNENYIYLFLLVGAITNFLDLLTYPLVGWGLLITWFILLKENEGKVGSHFIKVVVSGLAWIAGYAGMWIGKWFVGSIVLRENLFRKAISEAFLWTVNEGEDAITLQDRFRAIFINWKMYSYHLYYIVLTICLAYVVVKGLQGLKKDSRIPALLLIWVSSVVWYFVLAGHSLMHHLFAHRTYGVSVAAFLGIALLSSEETKKKIKLNIIPTLGIMGLISVFLMLQLKDKYEVKNWDYSVQKIKLVDSASFGFVPEFGRLNEIRLGLTAEEGTDGYCEVRLMKGEIIIDEIGLPITEDWKKQMLTDIPVDWKLKAKEEYMISVEPYLNNGDVYMYITTDGNMPLAELKETVIDGQLGNGQTLVHMTYYCRPIGKSACIFWSETIFAICFMIFAASKSLIKEK